LLIFSARILDSSVEREAEARSGSRRSEDAPARRAQGVFDDRLSCAAMLLDNLSRVSLAGFVDNQLSST